MHSRGDACHGLKQSQCHLINSGKLQAGHSFICIEVQAGNAFPGKRHMLAIVMPLLLLCTEILQA